MKVSGTSVLHAPPQQVWDAINDPYVLATVVPGCEGLTAITPGHFRLDVSLGVASIKGSYSGDVQFTDLDEPRSLIMHAAGAGSAGTSTPRCGSTSPTWRTEPPSSTTTPRRSSAAWSAASASAC